MRAIPGLAVAATVIAYASITKGFFAGDDFCHFFDAVDLPAWKFLLQPGLGHVLLFTNGVMWLMFHAFGMRSALYFAVTLAVHAANVLLLARLVERYTDDAKVGGVAGAVWGTSPLHVVTLAWFAVLGQVLLCTFGLALLLSLEAARERGVARPRDVALWIGLALAASTSFGMGLVLGLGLPAIAALVGPRVVGRRARLALLSAPGMTIVVYVVLRVVGARTSTVQMGPVLPVGAAADAWRYAVSMVGHMVPYAISVLGLPAFGAPRVEPASWRLGLGTAGIVAMAATIAWMGALARRRFVAVAAIGLGSYALVALGRAPLFSHTAITPGLAATVALHYHTFPSIGLVVCLCLAWTALARTAGARSLRPVAAAWLIAWIVGLGLQWPIFHPDDGVRADFAAAVADIEAAVEAAPPAATVVVPNRAVKLGRGVPCGMANLAGVFLTAYGGRDALDGRPVRFKVPRRVWQDALGRGDRIARVLVPDAP